MIFFIWFVVFLGQFALTFALAALVGTLSQKMKKWRAANRFLLVNLVLHAVVIAAWPIPLLLLNIFECEPNLKVVTCEGGASSFESLLNGISFLAFFYFFYVGVFAVAVDLLILMDSVIQRVKSTRRNAEQQSETASLADTQD